jgi:hypothetical protein
MSESIANTPNFANGMLASTALVGFPLISGAFDAVDSVVDAVKRNSFLASAASYGYKAAQFQNLARAKSDSVSGALAEVDREMLKVGLEQMTLRAEWFTEETVRQVVADNAHVSVVRIQLELAKWLAEPMRNAISAILKKGGEIKIRVALREIGLEMVKQADLLLGADISQSGEPSYGLQQLGKGFLRKTLIVLGAIPLAAVVIVAIIAITQ